MEAALAVLGSLLTLILFVLNERAKSKPAREEAKDHAETDANLVNPDPTNLGLELDRLYIKAGGPSRQPHPQAGDFVQPDERQPE